MSQKLHVKTGDTVVVISGKDKGKQGKVKAAMPKEGRVVVEGVNMIKRHTKPGKPEGRHHREGSSALCFQSHDPGSGNKETDPRQESSAERRNLRQSSCQERRYY